MSANRPYVISIAGLDPSAGAGLLADIKCFEQHQVYGFGICSALTIQTDQEFFNNDWLDARQIIEQIKPLQERFNLAACKIGLIRDLDVLDEVVVFLRKHNPSIQIVVDPVLKASTGFEFHYWNNALKKLALMSKLIDLITPNYLEMKIMCNDQEVEQSALGWAKYCPVLLKGGHHPETPGTDYLFEGNTIHRFNPAVPFIYQKHGSGCVMSASITAHLALGRSLKEACITAKRYIENFLNSNPTLLGYHSND